MDKHLKERLVGAVLLVAAAIIFLPEMLSGPRDPNSAPNEEKAAASEGALKSYTIDLRSPKVQDPAVTAPIPLPAAQESTPAPPEELVVKAEPSGKPAEKSGDKFSDKPAEKPTGPQLADSAKAPAMPSGSAASKPATEATKPVAEKPASEKAPADAAAAKAVVPKTSDKTADKSAELPVEKTPATATQNVAAADHKWAVQVASLSTRANADKAVADLKTKGQAAFVSSFQSKGQTLYRVRIGPVIDRAAADALLKKVKPLYPGANVVAHP